MQHIFTAQPFNVIKEITGYMEEYLIKITAWSEHWNKSLVTNWNNMSTLEQRWYEQIYYSTSMYYLNKNSLLSPSERSEIANIFNDIFLPMVKIWWDKWWGFYAEIWLRKGKGKGKEIK